MRALFVDDDPVMGRVVMQLLESERITARWATSVAAAISAVHTERPDLVILERTLPDGDGLRLCEAVRRVSEALVLIVSSRGEVSDRLAGLESGADDYLAKPFEVAELRSRVRALLRRRLENAGLVAGGIRLNEAEMQVSCDSVRIRLTRTEFGILRALMRSRGNPVSRAELLKAACGGERREHAPGPRAIDTHVGNLRRKLREGFQRPDPIAPVRGIGYRVLM
ncbi:MAG: response regulator transcription factor [Candidatus Eremiobacterota bacterium]